MHALLGGDWHVAERERGNAICAEEQVVLVPVHCLSMGGNETLTFRRNLQDTLDGGVPLGSAFGLGILAKRARNL